MFRLRSWGGLVVLLGCRSLTSSASRRGVAYSRLSAHLSMTTPAEMLLLLPNYHIPDTAQETFKIFLILSLRPLLYTIEWLFLLLFHFQNSTIRLIPI